MTFTHIVSFKYGSLATPAQRAECFDRFFALKTTVGRLDGNGKLQPLIQSLVGGTVDAGEGLHKGFDVRDDWGWTHCRCSRR